MIIKSFLYKCFDISYWQFEFYMTEIWYLCSIFYTPKKFQTETMDKDGDNDSSTVQHSSTAVSPAVFNTDQLYKLALQYFKVIYFIWIKG